MTLAAESPAALHAAARRAVEYLDDHAPLLDGDASNLHQYAERPSLLAYNRSTWRASAVKPRYAPSATRETARISTASTEDEPRGSEDRMSWYTSDEDSPLYLQPFTSSRRRPFDDEPHLHEGEEESKEDDESKQEDDHDEDDDEVLMMEDAPPRSADVPLLETDEDEPEKEVDTILGDLTRLPRTTIIDEDGFLVDPRESLSHPAASGAMGLGVSRPGLVIKSGLLFKQGFGFLNGGWKVRHVELTSSKLTFFKGENGRKRGEIDLSMCSPKSIEIMPRDSVFDGAQATMWRFAIKVKGRRVMLSAYSEADMKEWLRCLHVALAVQSSGAGRFTDLVVPNGTLLANKGDGLMRASGSGLLR